jgi:hypothetical protein
MKKIIDGKRYDTETATLVARNTTSSKDFYDWCDETLYRTANGAWFLVGEGYARSRWASIAPDGMRGPGGPTLQVVDAFEARDWLERFDEIDALEHYWPIRDA